MARIRSTGTAVPPYHLDSAVFKDALDRAFGRHFSDLRPILRMAERCGVQSRFIAVPPDEILAPRTLTDRNRRYGECAVELGERAARQALERSEVSPAEIDVIVTVSCTGYMLPSLDAHLAGRLGLRPDVRRLPITEMGCLAGVAAFARAADLISGRHGQKALIVAAEFPSLTFQPADDSMDNLVSTLVFADGVGAAVLSEDDSPGIEIVSSRSLLLPDSLTEMGFDLRDGGFHVVLSKDVPGLLAGPFGRATDQLLADYELTASRLAFACIHPGGPKILRAVDEALGVEGLTRPSWSVLSKFGNQSSAAVFFILSELSACGAAKPGAFGLMAGFGPGLSLELCLLQQRP